MRSWFLLALALPLAGHTQELQTEHLSNPMGIDTRNPRFTWWFKDGEKSYRPETYTLIMGTDSAAVAHGRGNQWQHQGHDDSAVHVYAGKPLTPFTKYFWQVSLTNTKGQPQTSAVSSFETGMMEQKNWQGSWIGDTRDIHRKPAAYFRKRFDLSKKIVSARVYIAAAGLYELSINGHRVGDHLLDPMYTRFDRRNLYVAYDVTSRLQQGANAVGVLMGNGWYNLQSTAVWYFDKAPWRARPSFCLDLKITYADGSTQTISSDKSWKTILSPIVFNSIYTAEHIDARKTIPHWNEPGLIDTAWKDVIFMAAPSQNVTAQTTVPIRITDTLPAIIVKKFSDTDYVFDIGRNIAGISSLTVQGPAGTVIRLKHGERLYPDGHVDQSNIDVHYRPTDDTDPFQTDIYTLNGQGEERFLPHFNYKGFQYVEVTSSDSLRLTKESVTGYFMHSDVHPMGMIQASDTIVGKIWAATNASYLSNLFGYPTDCPQREKNGWTGDAQIAVETGLYNFDAITVYEKWLADLRDEQQPNGILPSIVPTGGWGYEWGNGPDWTSALAIIPWNVYLFYGDDKLLGDCYDNIRRYVDHINNNYPDGLTSWGLGDWIPVKSQTPVEFTSTCYYYADVIILANAARLFHHDKDVEKYTALAEKIKTAFNKKYLDETTGSYDQGFQTELSAALYWYLVPAAFIPKTAKALAARVKKDGVKLDVGLLGTKTILNALSENGYNDLAYALASDTAYPSWGHWIVHGSTTLLENWSIDSKSDVSRNHIMFGEIGAWFYKGLGGILPDTAAPGFRHIHLRPHIPGKLKAFSAAHNSPYGPIHSGWTTDETGIIHYRVTLPPGVTADLRLEVNGKLIRTADLAAGTTQFDVKDKP
jgi:alpha-L-rhamnosidase